jgi:hypothetical protein
LTEFLLGRVDIRAIALGIDEGIHRVLRGGARDELAIPGVQEHFEVIGASGGITTVENDVAFGPGDEEGRDIVLMGHHPKRHVHTERIPFAPEGVKVVLVVAFTLPAV